MKSIGFVLTKRAAVAALFSFLTVACGRQPVDLWTIEGEAMGTSYHVRIADPPSGADREAAAAAVAGAVDRVNQLMSTYLEDSELSRLNRAPAGAPFEVSSETLEVLTAARRIGEASRGALDVTVGPLVNAYGFGPDKSRRDPSDAEIERLRGIVGWDKILLDEAARTIVKSAAAVYVDLSSVAKGYAVDRVFETLAQLGYVHHMSEIGGEVRAVGRNERGVAWRIAIERPIEQGREIERVLPIEDVALATSGEYRNYYEGTSGRVSHTIDPRIGRPISRPLGSVTVLAVNCLEADGWATALNVLGPDEGFEVAVEQGLVALFVTADEAGGFTEKATPAFEARFGRTNQEAL